jgi:hypothetical protein
LPYEYNISQALGRVRVTVRGKINFKSFLDLGASISLDERFRCNHSIWVDLREMDFVPNTEEVHDFALSLSGLKGEYQGPIAILSQPGFIFGIVRMTCLLAETNEFSMGAFHEEAEAEQWIVNQAEVDAAIPFS